MESLIKNNKFLNRFFYFTGSALVNFIGFFLKVNDKQILFSAGMGNGIFDSPLVIYNSMIKDPKYSEFKMYWAVKDPSSYVDTFNCIKIDTIKYFYIALTSKIWITSVNIERGLKFKKKDTIYINTWHGVPLKYIGLDVETRLDYNFSHVDMFISSGKYETDIYKSAFNLNADNIYELGNPRNIKIYNYSDAKRNDVLQMLNLSVLKEKKVVLYAPTWKDYKNSPLDLDYIVDKIDESYRVLVKSHPLDNLSYSNSKIIDVSHVSDINDLLLITDVLISDYSSVMIDFSILSRPIIAYVPDFEIYKKTRGLYVTYKDLAPNIFTEVEEVALFLENLDVEDEAKKAKTYREKFYNSNPNNSVNGVKDYIERRLLC